MDGIGRYKMELWFCSTLLLLFLGETETVYTLSRCFSDKIDVYEDRGTTIECHGILKGHNIYWSITDGSDNEVRIGDCRKDTDTTDDCTDTTDDYQLTRPEPEKSLLNIRGQYRDKAGKRIKCSRLNNATSANCTLRVFYPGTPTDCQITTNVDTWTVQGTCRVEKVFASDGYYDCIWEQRNTLNGESDWNVTRRPALSAFIDANKLYYKGNCTFNHSLPVDEGNYTYKMTIQPGTTLEGIRTVEIEVPGDPHINCSEFAIEGTTHTCQCTPSATRPGKPPPSLSWPGLFSTGELRLSDVQRYDNGTQFTCQLTWGPDHRIVKTANYTLQVAYGPGKATITLSEIFTNRTRLTCTVDAFNPAAVFTWTGVVCDTREGNQTHDVCVTGLASDNDGKEVTCTATNIVAGNLKASTSFSINLRSANQTGQGEAFPTAAVAGGVGASVVVIISVTVVVVIIKKRRKNASEDEDNEVINNTEDQNESERQTYDRLQPDPLADDRNYTQLTVSNATSSTQSQADSRTYDRLCPDSAADERTYTALAMSTVSSNVKSQDNTYYNTAVECGHPATSSYTNVETMVRSGTRATVERPGIHTDPSHQINIEVFKSNVAGEMYQTV